MLNQTLKDRYTITASLGQGAMGRVYRATDTHLGREVAIKVVAQLLALDAEMLERFRREGEALRQLRHANIVGFVDMFDFEGHQAIVMDFVGGGSLHALIEKGPLSVAKAVRIALELSDALAHAHHIHIIHRDIKPENVLLDQDGTPKLTDFGVARLVSQGVRLTSTGTQIGTPYYMSPEAWEGKTLDAQAYIWSLGVMLYEMLAGEVPFAGDTMVAVMNKVLTAPLPDLKARRSDAPPALIKIIQRMLARDKAQRYLSMREVAVDLERVMNGEDRGVESAEPTAVVPGPGGNARPDGRRSGRRRFAVPLVAVAAVLILGGAGAALGFNQFMAPRTTPMPPASATRPVRTATATIDQAATATTMALSALPPIAAASNTPTVSRTDTPTATLTGTPAPPSATATVTKAPLTPTRKVTLPPAPTATPSGPKRITSLRSDAQGHIYAKYSDGTDVYLADGGDPVLSPNGTKIAFKRDDGIYVMGADGSSVTNLDHPWLPISNICFSSNTEIVFQMTTGVVPDIYAVFTDRPGRLALTHYSATQPVCLADGRITFLTLAADPGNQNNQTMRDSPAKYIINADGSNVQPYAP
jgi:tRNA A-37 threonylcarbamoyl transferase component Bud32